MHETPRDRKGDNLADHLNAMLSVGKNAIREVRENREFRFIILLDAVFIFAIQGVNMQWQPFFAQWVDNTMLGFIKAGIALSLMLGSRLVSRFFHKRGTKETIFLSFLWLGFPLFLAVLTNNFLCSLGGFLLHEVARGVYSPIKSAYLNEQIKSKDRATLLSVVSMFRGICGACGLFVSGLVAQYLSIHASWTLSGLCFILFVIFYARKNKV
jgi:MFS family permease